MNKLFSIFNFILFILLVLSIGFFLGKRYEFTYSETGKINGFSEMKYQNKLSSILNLIQTDYVENIDKDSLVDNVINEMMNQLDPHSIYINKQDSKSAEVELNGKYKGLGIEFIKIKDTFVVSKVLDQSKNKTKLFVGDQLLSLNGKSIIKMDSEKTRNLILNINLDEIPFSIKNNSGIKNVKLEKTEINIPSVIYTKLNSKTGYIKISVFGKNTYNEFNQALINLKKQKIESLILDLRNNPGGLIESALEIADEFLSDKKLITYTLDKNKTKKEYFATSKGSFETGKIAVLVNENSASASELLSGALQDHKRAFIFGKRTFGKGLVQKEVSLNDGSIIRLTIAQYYTPKGRNIQRKYEKGHIQEYYDEATKQHLENLDTLKIKKIDYSNGGILPDFDVNENYIFYDIKINELAQIFIINQTIKFRIKKNSSEEFSKIDANYFIEEFDSFLKTQKILNYNENKNLLAYFLKACIGEKLFGNQEFYKIYYPKDKMIKKALDNLTIKN